MALNSSLPASATSISDGVDLLQRFRSGLVPVDSPPQRELSDSPPNYDPREVVLGTQKSIVDNESMRLDNESLRVQVTELKVTMDIFIDRMQKEQRLKEQMLERDLQELVARVSRLENSHSAPHAATLQSHSAPHAATLQSMDDYKEVKLQALQRRLDVFELKFEKVEDTIRGINTVEAEGEVHRSRAGEYGSYTLIAPIGPAEDPIEAQTSHLMSLVSEEQYQLQETIWEAIVLVFEPAFGNAASVFIIFCLLLNFISLVFVCYIVGTKFTAFPYPSIASVDLWRVTSGHDARTADISTGTSLVSRVCQGDSSLAIANGQHAMLNEIRQYTGSTYSVGPLLCICAISLWTLTVVAELRSIFLFMWSVKSHLGQCTLLSWSGKDFVLITISRGRCVFTSIVTFARGAIAILLLVSGSMWLAQTKRIMDLLLNTSALNFILEVDEVMFATFAPYPVKVLVRSLRPISHPRIWVWKGMGSTSMLIMFGVTTYVVGLTLLIVWPGLTTMVKLEEALCKGNQDFVYGVQSSTGLMYASAAEPFTEYDAEYTSEQYTVRRIARGADPRNISGTSYTTWGTLRFKMSQSMDEYASMWSLCVDFPPPWPTSIANALRQATGKWHAKSCAELKNSCSLEEQRFLRLMCPVTCGCASPRSGLLLSSDYDGCPRTSCRASKPYREALERMPCKDMRAEDLEYSEAWNLYFDQWLLFWNGQFPDAKDLTGSIADEFRRSGCKGMASDYMDDLCAEGLAFQSIRPFCPETCGCATRPSSDFVNCPISCSSR